MRVSKRILAAAVLALAPSAAMASSTVYNGQPADGWFFGSGNNYSPANTAVLTDGTDQLYLRWHQTFVPAPASSAAGVYSFALGTSPLSFDWGIDGTFTAASITVLNLGTNASATYNVFDPWNIGAPIFNDNVFANGSTQNSARLSFGFLGGVGFDPNVNDTYRVTLNVTGMGSGAQSLSVDAKIGAGAAPEPATWAMMVGGFGLVGAAMRRRQRTTIRFA